MAIAEGGNMSVLITGIEMPKDKAASLIICPSGKVYYEYLEVAGNAVPVPVHGRLIDEQWLKNAMITTLESLKKNPKMDMQEMHLIAAFNTLRAMVEDAPTIIPAHGRLGDLDALDKAFTELRWDNNKLAHWGDRKDWCLHGSEIEALISAAPTIIPANKEN